MRHIEPQDESLDGCEPGDTECEPDDDSRLRRLRASQRRADARVLRLGGPVGRAVPSAQDGAPHLADEGVAYVLRRAVCLTCRVRAVVVQAPDAAITCPHCGGAVESSFDSLP